MIGIVFWIYIPIMTHRNTLKWSVFFFYDYYETLENEIYGEIDTAVKGQRTEQFDVNSVFLCHLNLQNASLLLKDSEMGEHALP